MTTLREIATNFDIPLVKAHGSITDVKAFIGSIEDHKGIEGFVLRFANGHMLKIKCFDYLALHKAKEGIAHEKNVWAMVINESADDLKSFLEEDDRKRVESFETDLWCEISCIEYTLMLEFDNAIAAAKKIDYSVFEDADRERKKQFAMHIQSNVSGDLAQVKSILYGMYDGKNCREMLVGWLLSNLSTGSKLDRIRPLFNNIKFEEREIAE